MHEAENKGLNAFYRSETFSEFMSGTYNEGLLARSPSILVTYLGVLESLAGSEGGARAMFGQLQQDQAGPLSWHQALHAMLHYCKKYTDYQQVRIACICASSTFSLPCISCFRVFQCKVAHLKSWTLSVSRLDAKNTSDPGQRQEKEICVATAIDHAWMLPQHFPFERWMSCNNHPLSAWIKRNCLHMMLCKQDSALYLFIFHKGLSLVETLGRMVC